MRKGQLDDEEKKRKEAYEQHKCKGCVWGKWENKNTIVFCGYSTCVREREQDGIKQDISG